MSHATDWTCRSCRAVLGHVRDGVLRPLVPVESVDGRGVVRVPCPDCGRIRMWEPSVGSQLQISSSARETHQQCRWLPSGPPDG